MNKKIKKLIAFTALTGTAMYAFNKFIDYTVNQRGLTLDENENYYVWKNGTIYYEKKGTGTPLLLIHDLNPIASSYEWSKVIDKLSETHTVYAIDLLGCGKSDKPAISYVNYLYVQLVNDFINHVIQQKTELMQRKVQKRKNPRRIILQIADCGKRLPQLRMESTRSL